MSRTSTAIIYQALLTFYRLMPFKKFICLFLRALPVNKEKFYRDLTFNGAFTVRVAGRKLKLMHFGATLENEIFWKGIDNGWEKISLEYWMKRCRQSNTIIDAGANSGIYSLVAAHVNPHANIYAFEPSKRMLHRFNQNILLNGFKNIHPFEVALSNYTGTAAFYDFNTETQYSASLNKEFMQDENAIMETTVTATTLHDFIIEHKIDNIELMKIDVEMHEPEVLEGMGDFLRQFKSTLLIEVLDQDMAARIAALVNGLDYLFFDMDDINPPRRIPQLTKSSHYNILLCNKNTAQQLGLKI